jgi:hypothetical protein
MQPATRKQDNEKYCLAVVERSYLYSATQHKDIIGCMHGCRNATKLLATLGVTVFGAFFCITIKTCCGLA